MKFYQVALQFQKIEDEPSRLKMTQLLADLFKQADSQEIAIIANFSLGLLRPPYRGTQFNLARKSLTEIIARVLHVSVDQVQLWYKQLGDLGLVFERQATAFAGEHFSLVQVFRDLEKIEHISGAGSQEDKSAMLAHLLTHLEPVSAKYVIRIILGNLRMGFSDMTIIDALSWMQVGDKALRKKIEHAYNICVDIGLVAQTLKEEGIEGIEKMKIHPGIPIRPAAAERLPTIQQIIEKLGTCIAQPKIDGFRLQIHVFEKDGMRHVKFFSRNLTDMSSMFPDLVNHLAEMQVQSVIFEGEAIAYDINTQAFLPFQETVKRKRKHGIDEAQKEYPLRIFLFDVLYVDGKSYLSVAYAKRREKLINLSASLPKPSVQAIEEVEVSSQEELKSYFYQEVQKGLEGIVVKKKDAPYQPGKRNFNWIKFKRQEEGSLEDTLDCLVLGYYAGAGKRASYGIGACLVGVYNKNKDVYETIAKIGTGFSDEQWRQLKAKCDNIRSDTQPKNVICARELMPDVWTFPEIVCAVRADEITQSPLHTAGKSEEHLGFALRFPRFIEYRLDKGPEEVTTVTEVKHLYQDQFTRD